jgi:hypothetical protein
MCRLPRPSTCSAQRQAPPRWSVLAAALAQSANSHHRSGLGPVLPFGQPENSAPVGREIISSKLLQYRLLLKIAQFAAKTANSGGSLDITGILQTYWRRMQSRANRSLARFPANREKYREFRKSGRPNSVDSSRKRFIYGNFCCQEPVSA